MGKSKFTKSIKFNPNSHEIFEYSIQMKAKQLNCFRSKSMKKVRLEEEEYCCQIY